MKKLIIYIDGGSRGNPGPSGIGAVVCNQKGDLVKEYSEFIGKATNNQAEYSALIFGLKKLKLIFSKQIAKTQEVEVRSDSELLIKQMKGEYKIMNAEIQKLFLEAWNLRLDFAKVKFKLVPRSQNKNADRLVNEALDSQSKTQKLI